MVRAFQMRKSDALPPRQHSVLSMRGQGATEYLVLLAVVLIIALVSIALLGFFPGLATDAKITQSNSYWRGEVRPFQILEHSVGAANGTMYAVLQNVDASGTFTVTSFGVGNGTNTTATTFAPGEIKTLFVSSVTAGGSTGAIYDLNVTIRYTSPNGIANIEAGTKNIVGKYS